MAELVIYSDESLQKCIGELRTKYAQYKYLRVNVKAGKDRSLDASAQIQVWYEQAARERGAGKQSASLEPVPERGKPRQP